MQRLFNVSSGVGTSLNELIKVIEGVVGRPVERRYLPGRPFDVPASVICNELARSELNWAPVVSLPDGIARTAAWIKRALAG